MGEENGDAIENNIYRYFLNRIYRVRRCKIFTLFVFFVRRSIVGGGESVHSIWRRGRDLPAYLRYVNR
jgi:hypothetical protein